MPRYFFNIFDGSAVRDRDGSVLPDIYVAQAEAIRLAGEVLRDMGGRFWDGTGWRLEVSDEGGQVLFVLHVSAEERMPEAGSEVGPEGEGPGTDPQTDPARG